MTDTSPQLTIIGDVGVDLVMGPIDQWPDKGTEIVTETHQLRPGGSACNAALAMGYLQVNFKLISVVGKNELGRWLSSKFASESASFGACDTHTSISVGITHPCSERTFFTTKGHLESLAMEHILPHLKPAQHQCDTALLTGAFLTPKLRSQYTDLIKHLRELGYQIAIDTGWPPSGWTQELRQEVFKWMPLTDHLLVNKVEALSLAEGSDLNKAICQLRAKMHRTATLVVKAGADGAFGQSTGALEKAEVDPVAVADSVGAGDSFNAGYLSGLLHDFPLAQRLNLGCKTAAAIISRPNRDEIQPGEFSNLLADSAGTGLSGNFLAV